MLGYSTQPEVFSGLKTPLGEKEVCISQRLHTLSFGTFGFTVFFATAKLCFSKFCFAGAWFCANFKPPITCELGLLRNVTENWTSFFDLPLTYTKRVFAGSYSFHT